MSRITNINQLKEHFQNQETQIREASTKLVSEDGSFNYDQPVMPVNERDLEFVKDIKLRDGSIYTGQMMIKSVQDAGMIQ